jgi:uncharacterized protein
MNATEQYSSIYAHVEDQLLSRLPAHLTYHSIEHTRDVLQQSERIARTENKFDEHEIFLLKVAALYHDTGFLHHYSNHEESSCELAKKDLPGFGLTTADIEEVMKMIRATKIPQSPPNKLAEVLCDADLDYLGRPDFFTIANQLFNELKEMKIISDEKEWDRIQVKFLKGHRYFTATNIEARKPQKLHHLKILEDRVEQY